MKKIILTKGLPASGKTTWAKEFITEHSKKGEHWKRINKDDLRAMLDFSVWSRENEKFILRVRDQLISSAIEQGYSIIIDDTNLAPKHEINIRQMVELHNKVVKQSKYELEIKDFTDVPPEECIKRDLVRPNSVGSKVILGMYNQFIRPAPEEYKPNPNLSDAIVCDLDGTLALFGDANPYDRDFSQDRCNMAVYEVLHREKEDRCILLVSGRKDSYRKVTLDWLKLNGVPYDYLFMREEGDVRKDVIVKKEIYEREIKGKYNVVFVFDDRNQMVDMWRSLGITCFQVNYGDF